MLPDGLNIICTYLYKVIISKLIVLALFFYSSQAICNDVNMKNSEHSDSEIFVITNRVYESNENGLSFLCKINPESSLTLLKVKSNNDSLNVNIIDSADFLTQINKVEKNLVLFIHGDSKTFEHAVLRGLEIQNLYNVKVIVFSWPSKDPFINGYSNLKLSIKNVQKSLIHFNLLLKFISNIKNPDKEIHSERRISLFLHSLGNYYLECMVKENMRPDEHLQIFDNIIINSAAVAQKEHKFWVEKLRCQHNIFIISNRHDFNLKGARLFVRQGKQLGELFSLPLAENAIYINFSKAVGFTFPTHLSHTFFIGEIPQKSKIINGFYYDILNSKTVDLTDTDIFIKREDGKGYDILF